LQEGAILEPNLKEQEIMTVSQEQLDQTKENFNQLISLLGLSAEVKAESDREAIQLRVKTEDPGRLIGRKGQTLNSLQHLLNGILLNKAKSFPKVLIDVEGSRDKERGHDRRGSRKNRDVPKKDEPNRDRIRQQAIDASKEVKRWGEDVVLSRMSESEIEEVRRILDNEPELEIITGEVTQNGPSRSLTIRLKKG
jgi:spoIIIJ-associated protein